MSYNPRNLLSRTNWREFMLDDVVGDLPLDDITDQLLWEEAWHSCALDGVIVPREEIEQIKQIAEQRAVLSDKVIEEFLQGRLSQKELSKVLSYSFDRIKPSWAKLIRYFEVASSMYALALQEDMNILQQIHLLPKIIHASLFYGIPEKNRAGEYRKPNNKKVLSKDLGITPLLVKYAPEDNIEKLMELWAEYTLFLLKKRRLTDEVMFNAAEHSHALFMSILPFEYGNGRVSRIILNILLMLASYLNAIIPSQGKDKETYLKGIEIATLILTPNLEFGPPELKILEIVYKAQRTGHLTKAIAYGLMDSYDILLTKYLSAKLIPLSEFAKQIGKKPSEVNYLLNTRKLIRKKIDGKWYVYPEIAPV